MRDQGYAVCGRSSEGRACHKERRAGVVRLRSGRTCGHNMLTVLKLGCQLHRRFLMLALNPRHSCLAQFPIVQSAIRNSLVAYTLGFPLADGQTFADFIEVADLSYPGLAAWTFSRLCREARDYPFLNLGADSELPTLARSKLACRPTRIVPPHILNAPL